ncbi:PDZ domain-containing protein [Paenibacillus glycanilyticus]|uniref:YlbL family protein n=1 Tax=Paenibacillus glycanilyticus TaxID=126569 RepID=UPI00203D20B2|nr:PDZ domain-containing protein [Paenibacillus glycanilyticus]MCM3625994.1 PDZ domain-containing protein [Paenibacillus glycanilyticus]
MSKFRLSGRKRQAAGIILIAIMLWIIVYAPTPLVIYEPGLTFETAPLVQHGSEQTKVSRLAEKGEEGAFLVTTVKLTDAKYWQVIQTAWQKDFDVYSKDSVLQGKSEQNYLKRMKLEMVASQNTAIEAAYRYAGIAYSKEDELYISDINGASKDVQIGDRVIKADGHSVNDIRQLTSALSGKKDGDSVRLTINRSGKTLDAAVPYKLIEGNITTALTSPVKDEISLGELQVVLAKDLRDRIEINAGEVGGPSAGLMFTLQSLNFVLDEDLTRGLRIAGTGTINEYGNVGAIGGINYKVAAADLAGAQLFLAPEDNYEEAAAKVKSLGSSMRVISVHSLQDAIYAISAIVNNK